MKAIKLNAILALLFVSVPFTTGALRDSSMLTESAIEHAAQKITNKDRRYSQSKKIINPPIMPNVDLAALAGPSHNQYGIRDDILKFIETNISPDETIAYRSAIRLAADDQFIYFKATAEEATKVINSTFISTHCLHNSMPRPRAKMIYKGLTELLSNTAQRKKRIQIVDEKYFGWKVMGFGAVTDAQLDEMCRTGKY